MVLSGVGALSGKLISLCAAVKCQLGLTDAEYLYGPGNIGFWNEADKEYHLGTFWCHLLPEGATISIHLTRKIPEA